MNKMLQKIKKTFEDYKNIEIEYSSIDDSILITKHMDQDNYIMLVYPDKKTYRVCARLQKADGQFVRLGATKVCKMQMSVTKHIKNVLA